MSRLSDNWKEEDKAGSKATHGAAPLSNVRSYSTNIIILTLNIQSIFSFFPGHSRFNRPGVGKAGLQTLHYGQARLINQFN